MRLAFLGTRGVPARYGGFETAVEEVGRRLVERGHAVTVYCRHSPERLASYRGMRLVHLPAVKRKSADTLSHTALSMVHAIRTRPRYDAAIVMNTANSPFLPLAKAKGLSTALHVDGLEWKRGKWGRLGRSYYLLAEKLGTRWADALIADARGIQAYYLERYGSQSVFIPYGAPLIDRRGDRLPELGLRSGRYHLVVARFEPENSIDVIVEGYIRSASQYPLIVVGNAPYNSKYTRRIEDLASTDDRVRLLGSMWDQLLLDDLYANALTYVHGHTVGGTNPSLLRAMGAGTAVSAVDVVFTREVLGDTGHYFDTPAGVAKLLEESEISQDAARKRGAQGRERAAALYDWEHVASDYERLCERLSTLRTA